MMFNTGATGASINMLIAYDTAYVTYDTAYVNIT